MDHSSTAVDRTLSRTRRRSPAYIENRGGESAYPREDAHRGADAEMDTHSKENLHILRTTAALADQTPGAFLFEICGKTGDSISLRDIEDGKDLPLMVRNELRNRYEKSLTRERDIIAACCEKSSDLARILFYFNLFAVVCVVILIF